MTSLPAMMGLHMAAVMGAMDAMNADVSHVKIGKSYSHSPKKKANGQKKQKRKAKRLARRRNRGQS